MFTIGGGTILEPNPARHKANDRSVIEELLLKEKGSPEDVVEQAINNNSRTYPRIEDIIKFSGKGVENIEGIIKALATKNKIIEIPLSEGSVYVHSNYLEEIKSKSTSLLDEFHRINPLKVGMSREEFKNKVLGPGIKQKIFDELIVILKRDIIETGAAYVWKKGFAINFDRRQEEIKNKLFNTFEETKFQPPALSELFKSFGREEKAAKMVFDALVDMDKIVKVNEDIYLTAGNLKIAKELLVNFIKGNGEITAAQYRDEIGASRKYAVAILEYFDSVKLTKRLEDRRILL